MAGKRVQNGSLRVAQGTRRLYECGRAVFAAKMPIQFQAVDKRRLFGALAGGPVFVHFSRASYGNGDQQDGNADQRHSGAEGAGRNSSGKPAGMKAMFQHESASLPSSSKGGRILVRGGRLVNDPHLVKRSFQLKRGTSRNFLSSFDLRGGRNQRRKLGLASLVPLQLADP